MRSAGFTLIEIMIVVVIIGVLAGVSAVAVKDYGDAGRLAATRATIKTLRLAVNTYELQLGKYPESLEELVIEGDKDWPGPFIEDEEVPHDGWGYDFKYELIGKRFRITSPGKDGRFGTEDDLWK